MVIAFALAGSFARPLTRLAAAARSLGEGDLSTHAPATSGAPDEVEELAGRSTRWPTGWSARCRPSGVRRERLPPAPHAAHRDEAPARVAPPTRPTIRRRRRQLEAADPEVDRLAETVDRLLVMAREVEEGAPTEAVQRRPRAPASRGGPNGRASEAPRSPPTATGPRLHADPTDLDQILDNLLDNAIAYAPGAIEVGRGGPARRARRARPRAGHRPRRARPVTERFYRGRGAPAGGSGLGLAIARDLAERWGGACAWSPGRRRHPRRGAAATCAGAAGAGRRRSDGEAASAPHVSDPRPRPTVWIDPGCPWAWETSRWLRDLRDRGMFTIEWRLFSLEVNTAGFEMPFREAADR